MTQYKIITFYKFIEIDNLPELQIQLLKLCKELNIKGTILLAREGMNATLVGLGDAISEFSDFIREHSLFPDIKIHESISSFMPFNRLKVKIKPEIITFKADNIDMSNVGIHVDPEEWDDLLKADKEVLVVDTRNKYEVSMGTFENAINPETENFLDFKKWADNLDVSHDKAIAMFCTGGVRCEKSTAYLKTLGYKNLYQLNGGILNYLTKTQNKGEKWRGYCFIFDDRRALTSDLEPSYVKDK